MWQVQFIYVIPPLVYDKLHCDPKLPVLRFDQYKAKASDTITAAATTITMKRKAEEKEEGEENT